MTAARDLRDAADVTDARTAALRYVGLGWSVFPLHTPTAGRCSCGHADCGSVGKHPRTRNGVRGASADRRVVETWWEMWPAANIGIATGAASGFVVLDIDPRHGGEESLEELEAEYGRLPVSPVALTGGGGSHSYFAHPGEGRVPNRGHLGGFRGIDLKGDGGYVVASPSVHASGRRYAWHPFLVPGDAPLPGLPKFLLELAQTGPTPAKQDYRRARWEGPLPSRATRLLRTSHKVRERFHRKPGEHADQSPSGVDASLASLLAVAGLSGIEIEAVIRESRARAGLPARRDSYYAATVGKALHGNTTT